MEEVGVELSNEQATRLAYALYPSLMEYCKKVLEESEDKGQGDVNDEK